MQMLLVVVVLLVLFAIISLVVKKRGQGISDVVWPFYAKKLMTQPEQVLYHRLITALPECIVLAQVQLSQVLGVKKDHNFNEWNNRINRMSLDFLVCMKDSTVVAAIELDDKTHSKPSRIEADAKKDKALSAAGITMIRWNVNSIPDENTIRQVFTETP